MSELLSSRWLAREQARLKLARLKVEGADSLPRAFARATEICAHALGVRRVGIWEVDEGASGLRLVYLHDEVDPAQGTGTFLPVSDLGAYEDAMRDRRVVAIDDVRGSPFTADLVPAYFEPLGIASTLDAPIYREGRVVGVVCHEHRGAARAWTVDEAAFAISVAEMVALLYASDDLRRAEVAANEVEREFQQALSTDALGELARSIAHDVNNLLGAISMQTTLLRRRPDEPDVVDETAGRVMELVDLAARLTHHLLEYARRPANTRRRTLIREALERTAPMLRSLAGEDRAVTLHAEDVDVAAAVPIDPLQIEQVLSNLVVNAREATEPGGVIALRAHAEERASEDGPSAVVVIEVEDDGRGMDAATRHRVFDPWFTTHAGGEHRGLGLTAVQTMLAAAGGSISVDSAPGEGTRFIVTLPLETGAPLRSSSRPDPG